MEEARFISKKIITVFPQECKNAHDMGTALVVDKDV